MATTTAEHTIICEHCGTTCEDPTTGPEDKQYCEDCFHELFFTCEHCNSMAEVESAEQITVSYPNYRRNSAVQETWCESCIDNHTRKCYACSERHAEDCGTTDSNNTFLCEHCRQNGDWHLCSECDCFTDDGIYRESRDASYCSECDPGEDEDEDPNSDLIHSHDYKPSTRFYPPTLDRKRTLYYGVELEINTDREDRNAAEYTIDRLGDHAYLKHDGSLSEDNGFEIVTHPHTLQAHRELWAGWFAKKPGHITSYDSGECGLHIHVGRSALSQLTIGKLLVFVNSEGNKPFIEAIAQRSVSEWAKVDPRKKLTDCKYANDSRYEAINLQNHSTIEFRIFRGNTRAERFFKALEFVDALIHWIRDAPIVGATDYRSFIKYVRHNRKQYRHLDNFLVERGYLAAVPKPATADSNRSGDE